MTKPTHGGTRPGAGRKPIENPKVPITKKLDSEIVEYLKACDNATEAIEQAIKRSKSFREWRQNRAE